MPEPFTASDKFQVVMREIEQRKRVYPRLVKGGSMTQQFADRQIAVMISIANDYRKLADQERLI